MTLAITRTCARCGKTLEDAASREAGVGPVCRKLDNALLARRILGDPGLALTYAQSLLDGAGPLATAPETAATLVRVVAALTAPTRSDWRTVVKQVEYLLSFDLDPAGRFCLYGIVEALGYVTIVAAWKGETSSGKAKVWTANARTWEYGRGPQTETGDAAAFVFVSGPRNPAFNAAVKKCAGARFHRPETSPNGKAGWSVPRASADALHTAVTTYYPNHEIEGHADMDALRTALLAMPSASAAAPAKVETPCRIFEGAGGWIIVRTPSRNVDFVVAVKRLPYFDRKWSPSLEAWQVRACHRAAVEEAARRFFTSVELHEVAA